MKGAKEQFVIPKHAIGAGFRIGMSDVGQLYIIVSLTMVGWGT